MKKRISKLILIVLFSICIVACGKTSDDTTISEKDKRKEMGIFYSVIKDKMDLSGTTYDVFMCKEDEWVWLYGDIIPKGYLGYLIEDFDQDGSDEMAILEIYNEVMVCLYIYEEVNGAPQLADSGVLTDLKTYNDTLMQKWVYIPNGNYILCEANIATCTTLEYSETSYALFQYDGTALDCVVYDDVRIDKLENDLSYEEELNKLCQCLEIKDYDLDSLLLRANFTDYIEDEIVIAEVRQQLNTDYESTKQIIDEADDNADDLPIGYGRIYGRGGDTTTYVSIYEDLVNKSKEKTEKEIKDIDSYLSKYLFRTSLVENDIRISV